MQQLTQLNQCSCIKALAKVLKYVLYLFRCCSKTILSVFKDCSENKNNCFFPISA